MTIDYAFIILKHGAVPERANYKWLGSIPEQVLRDAVAEIIDRSYRLESDRHFWKNTISPIAVIELYWSEKTKQALLDKLVRYYSTV